MISTGTAKLINLLPHKLAVGISKKVVNCYLNKYAHIHVTGLQQLQTIQTPTIFVCNHLSNADGLVLNQVLKSVDPTFVAGVKLSNNDVTNVAVHVVKTTNIKPNSADKEGLKRIINLVKQGESLLIFPEGTRSRLGSMIEAKKGIILIAQMTGAPIVPIGLYGTEKLLPINEGGDMSSENFHEAEVYVTIGKQFELLKREKEQEKKEYEEIATTHIMKQIAELLPDEYKGVYR
ncbi:MAG: lysophospholipid acyltransferase family protein [Clostridiales bacterium]|nr:lysophospholipid acyltransferase family protein [Clostridiales bacterium]